ncbi:ABC transporter permease [Sulfurimonas sp.]|uniref:ABC transporter permease n=1 Tax=Sulfurimonas sp. TaxID=2022749 RepID=UPI0035650E81
MIALRALSKNKFKSLLIFLSITIAVSAIFLISSISQGVIGMFSSMIKTDGDIIVTQKGIADTFFSNIDIDLRKQIDEFEDAKSSYAVIVGASPVGAIPIAGIYGVTKNHLDYYKLYEGKYPQEGEVIIGENIAKQIKDESVKIGNQHYKISGKFSSEIGFEQGGVIMNIEDAGKLFNRSASYILVSSKDPNKTETLQEQISKLSEDIEVKTTQSFVDEYNQFKIIENSSLVISTLAYVMGLMGIGSVMSMIVNSRKEEFGIMRALGKSRFFIVKNLFFEGVIMGVAAYVFALLLSVSILEIIPHIETLQGYVDGSIDLTMALYVFASTITMAIMGSILPAYIAAKTDPIILINQGCA